MKPENLKDLNDQELLLRLKKLKNQKLMDAMIIGFTIGIVIYAAVNKGFGFFTFFPLLLTFPIARNGSNIKMLENEIQSEIDARNQK